jgi:hypothetical protein
MTNDPNHTSYCVPTEGTSDQLGISAYVDPGVVRSSDAPAAPAPTGGPMSFRTSAGVQLHDPAAVRPDDVVKFGPNSGDETSVEVAMSMGLLVRNAAGHIVPAAPGPQPTEAERQAQQQREQQPKQQETEAVTSLDPDSEAVMSRAFTEAPGETIGAAVSAIENNGEVSPAVVEQLAARLNMERGEAAQKTEQVKAAYATEATTYTAKALSTSEAIVKEALAAVQHDSATKSAFRQAAQTHFMSGRPDGYARLAQDWIANLDQTDPSRILNSNPVEGRSVRYDHNSRQVIVKLPDGRELPWGVAVRNGLISIK